MSIDLSIVSDDFLTLILLRVPVKVLIGKCTQVSPQFNRILSESFIWRNKMEYDGYVLEWPKLVGLSTKSFQCLALKHCFNRNFIMDCWNFDEGSLTMDRRWWADQIIGGIFAQFEIPPLFLDGEPEIPPGYAKPIPACLAIGDFFPFKKYIAIKLADEGLTDEIMDNYRPTIVISEMIGNRRDYDSIFIMKCSLETNIGPDLNSHFRDNSSNEEGEYRDELRDESGRWISATIKLQFNQWHAESWHRVEHKFKDYPAGMRYLTVFCVGHGNYESAMKGHYEMKLANCSVKALCEKNAE